MNTKQFRPPDLRDLDALREDAAAALRRATTRAGKRYAPIVNPTALARARCGDTSNPVYRMAQLLVAMRRAGEPVASAELLLTWLQATADDLWADALPSVETAHLLEAAADAAEDAEQAAVMLDGGLLFSPEYVARLVRAISSGRTLLASIHRADALNRRVA